MERFNLKWNDFSSNVQKSFQNLRKEEDFFDITLIGDDYKHVTAHKLVLSSCSEYFKNVFSNNKKYFQSQAMICLEGLNHADLNNVLDYIYQGEVQIHQHDLDRFLGIAERLKLEGLMGGRQHEDESKTETVQKDVVLPTSQNHDLPVIAASLASKSEIQLKGENHELSFESSNIDIQSLRDYDEKIEESYTKISTGFYTCSYCDKSFRQRCHMREHVEIHLEGVSFPCTSCGALLRSRNSLRIHKRTKHRKC